jgi:hypothetical protein
MATTTTTPTITVAAAADNTIISATRVDADISDSGTNTKKDSDFDNYTDFSGDGSDPSQWMELFPYMTSVGNGVIDIASIIRTGEKIGVYPISENSWLDMGQLDEMDEMRKRLKCED